MEGFDTSSPPALPPGWSTSSARAPGGDFITTSSGALSPPGSVIGTNPTIEQWLTLPPFDLTDWRNLSLRWRERRSSTHNSSLAVEISPGPGEPFGIHRVIGPPDTTIILSRVITLPETSWDAAGVSFRVRVMGDGTGATGTIRLDDFSVDGSPARDLSVTVQGPSTGPGPALLRAVVRNHGFEQGREATLSCFRKTPDSDDTAAWVFHTSAVVGSLPPGDSTVVEFRIDEGVRREVRVLMVCSSPGDLVASNDSAETTVRIPVEAHSVVINEIMYDPPPGRAEYVELLNTTAEEIDLRSWRLSDSDGDTVSGSLGPGALLLGPGAVIVCSPDTTLRTDYAGIPATVKTVPGVSGLSLNNGGDILVLTDPLGRVIDRLEYLPSWHTPAIDDPAGRSLEKIDPSSPGDESWNWASSPDPSGGTPGRRNLLGSGTPAGHPGEITCRPNPFSPDGDGFEDATIVRFTTGGGAAVVRVRIFDSDGRAVRTLTRSSYVGEVSSIVWNGYDDEGNRAGIGIYIVLLEGVDGSGDEAFIAKGTVVVAGRL